MRSGLVGLLAVALGCACCAPSGAPEGAFERVRMQMVDMQIEGRGISDPRVLAAMRRVPRQEFVPEHLRDAAYEDRPLPIGRGQTISQPYIVAAMSELAAIEPEDRVLEIGTGSGYQAAVLAELSSDVASIEIVPELAADAKRTLARLGYGRIALREGDGWAGWPERAPFDAIVVTAAPPSVPPALLEQLAVGGRLVIPVGVDQQQLRVYRRSRSGIDFEDVLPVRFVPMIGGDNPKAR